jgi:hypothetical protein
MKDLDVSQTALLTNTLRRATNPPAGSSKPNPLLLLHGELFYQDMFASDRTDQRNKTNKIPSYYKDIAATARCLHVQRINMCTVVRYSIFLQG